MITACRNLELSLLTIILIVVFALTKDVKSEEQKRQSTQTKMMIGMIAGFCFITGLSTMIITAWCCCCGNGCKRKSGSDSQVTPVMELITQNNEPQRE